MKFENNHKIIAIHQPNYFPWLGYFSKMRQANVFVFLDNVDISLNSSKAITHRTKINYSGKPMWLTLPIEKAETKQIGQLKINSKINWREKQIQIIEQAYTKAPYFNDFFPTIKKIIYYNENNLSKFNAYIIKEIAKLLEIKTAFYTASELGIFESEPTLRLIKICKKLDGLVYLSGMGGKKYHHEALFTQNKIELKYSNYFVREYKHHSVFIPGLSVLDALFECGYNTTNLL